MKLTPAHEEILLDDDACSVDRANAIVCLRDDGVRRHESLLLSFLDHDCPELRGESLATLLSWGQRAYLPIALDWLRNASEPDLRVRMANALSRWALATPLRSKPIVSAIVKHLEEEPDRWAFYWTYVYARRALGIADYPPCDETAFGPGDIDWALLEPFRR